MAGIYIHIPFCKQACHYCDFHFSTNLSSRNALVQSIIREIELQKDYLNRQPVNTLYFGGGTPSILEKGEISEILNAVHKHHSIVANAEVTLEANPDDLTKDKLEELWRAGVNRLSVGIQSFDDHILKFFNRSHTGLQSEVCIRSAREVGFSNLSIDLIYAVPNQTQEQWQINISKALTLAPEHISAYSLTIEPRTAFGVWQKKGRITAVPDDIAASDFQTLVAMLSDSGYEQYEVSNFSKPGFHSKHNSSYWKQEHYLGLGPSAHSYNGVSRQFNISNNSAYVRAVESGKIPFEIEQLSREDHVNEYLLTTLRTIWGTDLALLNQRFGYDLKAAHPKYVDDLIERNLAIIDHDVLKLTEQGKLLADKISSDLFLDKAD